MALKLKGSISGRKVVVHFNFPGLHFLALWQFYRLKLSGIFLVLTVHDVIPHRWILPHSLNFLERFFLRRMYRVCDRLVVHHSSQRDALGSGFGVPPERVVLAHHGAFRLDKEALVYRCGGDFIALCFGAIRENKGLHLAIQATQALRAQGLPIRLLIVGAVSQGERQYWNDCKEMIEKNPDGVKVLEGFVKEEDVRQYFELASFVLLPYYDFFSQSGVATMSLSSGRAVVSTDAGGLSEFLDSERFGIRIPESSVDGVMKALIRVVEIGHAGLMEMGGRAFDYFDCHYSWDESARIQLKAYASRK